MSNYGQAKEILNKSPSMRKEPDVTAMSVATIPPGAAIDFVRIVPGKFNSADQWFELPNGYFVNYIVAGKKYFDVLKYPDGQEPVPPPPPIPEGSKVVVEYQDGRFRVWINGVEYKP